MNRHGKNTYTYLIGWRNLDTWYYGSRSANKDEPEDDLFVKYYTSSKVVKAFIEKNGKPDVIRVHRRFHTKKESESHESRFLKRVGAMDSHRWLNQSNNTFPHVNYTRSQETREKIAAAKRGVKASEETRAKMSESHKRRYAEGAVGANAGRKLSEEWKLNVAKSMVGKPSRNAGKKYPPRSEESKKKSSEALKRYWESVRASKSQAFKARPRPLENGKTPPIVRPPIPGT
jgi:hypothetical protein